MVSCRVFLLFSPLLWHHDAVVTDPDRGVPPPGGYGASRGAAGVTHTLPTLPTVMDSTTLLKYFILDSKENSVSI